MSNKESNKFSFGIGLFLIAVQGFNGFFSGYGTEKIIGIGCGVFLVMHHGFYRDASKWRHSPLKIIGVSAGIALLLLLSIYLIRPQQSESIAMTQEDLINLMVEDGKKQLPMDLGNGDTLVSLTALSVNALQYRYKIQISIDSANLLVAEKVYKAAIDEQLKSLDNDSRSQWKKMQLNFIHEFFDPDGNFTFKITITPKDY
jgi:hypothetical protein